MAQHCRSCKNAIATPVPDIIYCKVIADKLSPYSYRGTERAKGTVPQAFIDITEGDECKLTSSTVDHSKLGINIKNDFEPQDS